MNNCVLLGGAIQLTHYPPEDTALLTVRGKDHDLTPADMRKLAAALLKAAGGDKRGGS